MTRQEFVTAYRRRLFETYDWASNPDKLDKFTESVYNTLSGGSSWYHKGECVTQAWKDIGGKGVPTLTALRALS